MRIRLTSVYVDDQDKAQRFYTEILGFVTKHDISLGGYRWLTVTAPEDADQPDPVELLLEPGAHPAAGPYKAALRNDGIPAAQFTVDDVPAEFERLSGLGVTFVQEPVSAGPVLRAVFDDT